MTDEAGAVGLKLDEKTRQPNFGTRNARITYPQPDKVLAGVRVYVDRVARVETTMGDIEFAMRPDAAPNTVFNFLHLAEGGFYNGVIFHRIVAKLPSGHAFVIQAGDPTGTGDGGPGYAIDLEPSNLPHDFGVLSMARDDDPNTNGSQMFVALSREGTARLDGRYTAFAQALSGAEVIRKIAAVPVGENDRPLDPPMIRAVMLAPAPPLAQRKPLSQTPKPDAKAEGK
ncbi:MAG: peptidylprolyl isomerase [Phycisphaerae bacterium]|nr:peptidylprolyl isomerase [Phycisphaerae bacterium]